MRDELISRLHDERCSLVVGNGEAISTFNGRGISDLYRLSKENAGMLHGASVADKVVGKAAAALMIAGGVKEVFADIASTHALSLLDKYGVKVRYAKEVPHIINRTNTGWCPMEIRCKDCTTIEECLEEIEGFMKQNKDR
ncbi:DUF1893 domain-containing protein [Parabacteroides timonensis]|uniref:DUF1893 domain-containing protein n=1 Tax=Parabacteroides timonensis TaxID=1871013 RepID=UPI00094ED5D5|nr:DUF1893 domain-containing protein [Parabacteroides timonensis]